MTMASMAVDRRGLEVLDRERCLSLLRSVPVGRLGLSIDALPVVLPVNYVLDGERIVVGTGAGGKFDAAVAGAIVAFEADCWDPMTHAGWSVLVRGQAGVVTDPDDLERISGLPLRPWGDASDLRFVSVGTELVSGRVLDPTKLAGIVP
jgi:nitroimidazol reductase NimA-like FMN-containing flavoprotein (pyridoxamine 5'-phosphate oxidase superfamily)